MTLRLTISLLLCTFAFAAMAVPLPQPRPAALKPPPALPEPKPKPKSLTEKSVEKPAEAEPRNEEATKEKPGPEPTPVPPGTVEVEFPIEPVPDPICDALETSKEAEFERLPRLTEGECGALTPIRLIAIRPKDSQPVVLDPPITTQCAIASSLVTWVRDSLQPMALKHLGEAIKGFQSTGGYQCRPRNHVAGAKMSEHAKANAIDIGYFQQLSGKTVKVGDPTEPGLAFMTEIRGKACGPFTTVLGPGSDPSHAEHFHLDLAKRGRNKNALYCK